MDVVRATRGAMLGRVAVVFLATWVLFYLAGWNEASPIYTDSDGALLRLALAWWGVGVVLLAVRQRSWGQAWLLGSTAFLVGYVVLILFVAFSWGS
jgi:hypothetical protein